MSTTIGNASEISNNSRQFYTIGGENIVILNVDGELYAIQNSCPHMGGSLGEGKVSRKSSTTNPFVSSFRDFTPGTRVVRQPAVEKNASPTLSCPLHGWEFDLADGTPVFPAKRGVRTYAVWVEDGLIKIDLTIETDLSALPG